MGGLLQTLRNGIDSLLHPAECILCQSYHETELPWVCEDCALLLREFASNIVSGIKLDNDGSAISVYSAWFYDDRLQNIIHALKYDRHPSIGPFLGKQFGQHLNTLEIDFSNGLLVPVPLHRKRLLERGFNQSERVGLGIVETLPGLTLANCLERVVYTKTQTNLSRAERQQNVRNAFKLKKRSITGIENKRVFLLDDVFTTGSTMKECSKVMSMAGAKEIVCLTLASTQM